MTEQLSVLAFVLFIAAIALTNSASSMRRPNYALRLPGAPIVVPSSSCRQARPQLNAIR